MHWKKLLPSIRMAGVSFMVETMKKLEMISRLRMSLECSTICSEYHYCCDLEVEIGCTSLFFAEADKVKACGHLAKGLLEKMRIRMWDFEVRSLEEKIARG